MSAEAGPVHGDGETRVQALRWFTLSRIVVALGLVAIGAIADLRRLVDPGVDPRLFQGTAVFYLLLSLTHLMSLSLRWVRRRLDTVLVVQVLSDLAALAFLIHTAGGMRSGLGALMIASVAGAAVVATPLISIFLAAVAALMLLVDTTLRMLASGFADAGPMVEAGLLGAAAFVTAAAINWLARRLVAEEALARKRGADVDRQLAITRRVIAELDQGVVVVGADGTVRTANPTAWQLLGVPRGSGADDAAAVQPAWAALTQALARWRASQASGDQFELSPDAVGAATALRVRVLPLDGPALGDTVLLIEDRRLIEQRAQQLKLASMGRLSASIAHEIRNPLAAIRHANSLLAERQSDALGIRLSGIVESNSVRIDRIVEDVMSISRREAPAEAVVDLSQFLPTLVSELTAIDAHERDASVQRIAVALSTDALLRFDPNQLRQVLVNLVGNAMRYASHSEGAIRIEWAQASHDRLELRIVDDGPGLGQELLQHVFEPFFTTEAQGTGLGLYLAREICHANGAGIRYDPPAAGRHGAFVIEPRR